MVKPRTTVPSSSAALSEEPDPFAAGLEAHRAETVASLKELQSAMLASMRSQSDTMRSEIMDELRQLHLGSKSPLRPQAQPFPPPMSQTPSFSQRNEFEPVISQVLSYQPNPSSTVQTSIPPSIATSSGVPSTVDLSVLPLYSAYVTSGIMAQTVFADGVGSFAPGQSQIPFGSITSDLGSSYSNTTAVGGRVGCVGDIDNRGLSQFPNLSWCPNPWYGQQFGHATYGYYLPTGHNSAQSHSYVPTSHSNASVTSSLSPSFSCSSSSSFNQFIAPSQGPQSLTSAYPNNHSVYATTTTSYPQFHPQNPLYWNTSPNPLPNNQHHQLDPHLPTMK